MNEIVAIPHERPLDAYRMSTDAASVCREIVVATATTIQGRKFVAVEGWQALALAHGCVAGSRDVERVDGGVRAIGEVRRMSDGQLIAQAEGFVGEDETTWFGGKDKRGKVHDKRNDYAIRAMAQTRAISRACRSAFAHVVVMMKANLETTPAAEVPAEGFDRDTGEIFEATPTHEPAAREKLDGPHTSKTALKAAVTKIVRSVEACATAEAINTVKDDNKRTINQARRDWPELIDGNPNVPEDIGLKGTIEKRREELTETTGFQFLMSLVEECETTAALQNLAAKHEDAIVALDGEESRRFQTRFDEREAGLGAAAVITA